MKQIYLIIFLLSSLLTQAQIVNIPDVNFKNALINHIPAIDANNDGEIQTSEAQAVSQIVVYNSGISDMTGIEAFINLQQLSCPYNQITNIDVSNNTNLTHLQVFNNQLTSLDISNNTNLTLLNCSFNQISNLNLSNNLAINQIQIYDNQISNLDLSNNSLLYSIEAENNQISNITIGNNNSITHLYVNNNLLTNINLENALYLKFLRVGYNQLTNINLINNSELESLYIENNSLNNLDIGNNLNIWDLNCSNNNLTSLDLTNNQELTYAVCSNNQLNSIDVDNINLWELNSSNNSLTFIDISGCTSLFDYNFSNNPLLSYIIFKNGNNHNYSSYNVTDSFNQLPNLQNVCVDNVNSNFTDLLQNEVPQSLIFTEYCSFTPGGEYYSINGNIVFDSDNNGCDIVDIVYPNLILQISDGITDGAFYSNELGEYTMPIQEGNYTITPQLENPNYFSILPSNINVNFPTDSSPYTQDFCVTPNGVHNDLEVTIIPLEAAQPGFDTDYKIIFKNKGNTTLSGNIDFTFDDDYLDLLSSNPIVDSQSTGNLIWNYINLQPFETREISLTMTLNTPTDANFPLNSGDLLNYSATISPLASDETPDDNSFNLNQEVVNSYDPNDKTCLEGEIVTPEQVGKYVHYLVRFENTGSANAINVVVKDIIDTTKYDISSLIPLNASHDFYTRIRNGNEVEFIFENIQLPFDDAINDGYILFKIKTLSTLNIGDSFSNEANIYFDYNAPIITNNETTTIQENLSTGEFNLYNIKIYPNPIEDSFKIENLSNSTIKTIELFNISGKKIKQFYNSESYDVNDLPSGVYFIKIKTEQTETNRKLIKL